MVQLFRKPTRATEPEFLAHLKGGMRWVLVSGDSPRPEKRGRTGLRLVLREEPHMTKV